MPKDSYGPWAVIAGGSEGVGAALALKLAAQGINLVLMARKTGPLEAIAAEARASGVEVRALSIDLAASDLAAKLSAAIDGIDIGLAIYNAGAVLPMKPFLDVPLETHAVTVGVNVTGCLTFCHILGRRLCDRGQGALAITGSLAGFAGTALIAAYGATKAFEQILAEGLWYEWRAKGVEVLCMPIGMTRTPANDRIGVQYAEHEAGVMSPEEVADEILSNLGKGPVWTAGAVNRETQAVLCSPERERVASLMSGYSMAVAPN